MKYGSLLADLIDGPVNAKMRLQLMSACYNRSLSLGEPRIVMTAIDIHSHTTGDCGYSPAITPITNNRLIYLYR
ncbi:hypothetical protein [Proteus vulgaris]|uniref:hypothetical protein n=1 Tax=Proteus vulgaris TaxID=585 RepID=UPI00358DB156